MVKSKESEPDPEGPPVFGSWRRVYWFVAGFFAAEVVAFYVFTHYYS